MGVYQFLDPHDILYAHTSINDRFRDGRSIYALVSDLRCGAQTPALGRFNSVPPIKVYETRAGSYVTHDHRRLWCFKEAFAHGSLVPCIMTPGHVPDFKFKGGRPRRTVEVRSSGRANVIELSIHNPVTFTIQFAGSEPLSEKKKKRKKRGDVTCPVCQETRFKSKIGAMHHLENGHCPHCPGVDNARRAAFNFVRRNPIGRNFLQPMLQDRARSDRSSLPEKPYQCPSCYKKFKTMGALTQHLQDSYDPAHDQAWSAFSKLSQLQLTV